MKKLAILFLLTMVIVSFTFAQVGLKVDFVVENVTKGNTAVEDETYADRTRGEIGYANPILKFVFDATASKDIGPGSLIFAGAVGIAQSFKDTDYFIGSNIHDTGFGSRNPATYATDDLVVSVGYFLPVGPGKLGFQVAQKYDPAGPTAYVGVPGFTNRWAYRNGVPNNPVSVGSAYQYVWNLQPSIHYKDIGLGPVSLGVGLYYNYKYNGVSTDNDKGRDKGAAFYHPYGQSMSKDLIDFQILLGTGFGLNVEYKFTYGWGADATNRASFARVTNKQLSEQAGTKEIYNIAYLNISYQIAQPVKVGLEVDDTGSGFRGYNVVGGGTNTDYNTETVGFTLKPYVDFSLGDLGFGLYLQFKQVLPTNVDAELLTNPGVWVKYTL